MSDLSPTLPSVAADRERILQVFSNLVGNALKFTPTDGQVEIRVVPHDTMMEFEVRDTGPGIASDELPRIFDRFWQSTKASHGGVGLGLAIAKGIVDAHGGSINVKSAIGSGSCFMFALPVATVETG